ncbi:Disease resistance protein RPP13 [Triticum urartu]|nr:Disease resistance protein RPP13 [Triticum urartu]
MRRGFLGALPWLANLAALHTFGVKIRRVRARIRQISDSAVAYGITDLGEASALADVEEQEVTPYDLSWNSADSDLFVGFHEERDAIFKELLDPEISPICVVSIVGMAGSGKSTLARKVYNDPRVKQHFHSSCWISVSEKYRFLDLIKDIARSVLGITRKNVVTEHKDQDGEGTSSDGGAISGGKWKQMTSEKLESMGEEDVKELLSDFLAQRKFLVVLDDVWKSSSYDKISKILSVLPDVNNGSRIILTTRDMDVARHVNRRSSIHEKKLLDEKESWELLEKWSFPEYRDVSSADRSRLMEIGKKLAVKCKGLPLALVVLGGYLSRNLDCDIWSGLVGNLDWGARRNDEPFWKIIDRSYNDLPNHQLKSCFLYLASFPEDYVIRVARLCKLLIAEGLIPHRQNRTLEDTAREYIKELVQRCMLQVVERSKWHGSIKSVVLHDVIREWAIAEARREGLFNIWSNPTDCDQALSDSVTAYRVALHNFAGRTEINVAMPKLRTLLVFFKLPAVSVLCRLKFLRVLDLHGLTGIKLLPSGVGILIHLRYFGLKKCGYRSVGVPSSASDLLNLQAFDARGSRIRSLPRFFWDIPTMRHLYLGEVRRWVPPEVGWLGSLQSFYFCEKTQMRAVSGHMTVKQRRLAENGNKHIARRNVKKWAALFRALEGMEQLVFLHLESWRTQRRTKWRGRVFSTQLFGSISRHRHLQVLELAGDWLCGVGQLSKLPHCLKKLKLIASEELSKDPMPVLGIHPNLVVLVLESAFKGNGMICHAEGFPRLRHLTFEHVGRLGSWNVEAGKFPSLTHLNLSVSSFPVVPPLGLFHVTSLQTLLLKQHPMDESSICLSTVGKLEERGCEVIIKRLG